ncbi:MAG: hypothetical protein AAB522_00230 [Patescibacteria group bacterium]
MQKHKSKFKIIKKYAPLFLILIFAFLVFVDSASAIESKVTPAKAGGGAAGAVGGGIVGGLLSGAGWGLFVGGVLVVLYHSLWGLLSLSYSLLNTAVNTALNPHWFKIDAVTSAWQLVRDFVNIWFILIFLFIAIATILRLQNYQAKKLLPMLIGIALIVNFSMPITGVIIDVSNIIAFQFLGALCPEAKVNGSCDFASNVENALDAKGFSATVDKAIEANPELKETSSENKTSGFLLPEANAQAGQVALSAVKFVAASILQAAAFMGVSYVVTQTVAPSAVGGFSLSELVNLVVTLIFLAVTVFVIASLAILFIIRIVSLLFLMILSPFGFASMTIPLTQKYANMWWNYLFKQSFFAPFSLFFLWFGLTLIKSMKDSFTVLGVPYDFTNPTNARLMFYTFSLVLIWGSLWIARKMGAIGADTLIKWGNWAKGAVTGFIGGLAARTFVAPLGAAITAKGIPEKIGQKKWLGGAAAGVATKDFAEWLAKQGKAPEKAAEKAELGMRLAPAERAGYFRKLDRAAKEAMLRKMKAEERESMLADLSRVSGGEAEAARQILRSMAFKPAERAASEVEEFQRKSMQEQHQEFANLSDEAKKYFLMRYTDDEKRAEFLQKVKEKNAGAAKQAEEFLEHDARFTAGQWLTHAKARMKQELIAGEKQNKLLELIEKLSSDDQKKYFGAMDDRQRLVLLEAWQGKDRAADLQKLKGWLIDMKPEDKDKFYRETVGKKASLTAVEALINVFEDQEAEQNKIIVSSSPQQLGRLAYHWETSNNRKMRDKVQEHVDNNLTGNQQKDYDKTLNKLREQGPPPQTPPPATPPPSTPPPQPQPAPAAPKAPQITPSARVIIEKLKTIDTISPAELERVISSARPYDLKISIDEKIEINPKFQEALINKIDVRQLYALRNNTNIINAVKKSVEDNELRGKNSELADYLERVKSSPTESLPSYVKDLKEKLFGNEQN